MRTTRAYICTMHRIRKLLLILLAITFLTILSHIWYRIPTLQPSGLREPTPISLHPHYPPPTRLLNITNFEFIANPSVCDPKDKILGVILVHSHPSNIDLRQAARDHISKRLLNEIGIRRVFLIGEAIRAQPKYPAVKQEIISKENGEHQDLIQGNFVEHYRNLTYKHIMGLTWTVHYCPQAEFIIKVDDDIAVDIFQIRQLIKYKYRNIRNQMLGLIQVEQSPLRSNASKWMVTEEEFSGKTYPSFLSGWCYIAPKETIQRIVSVAHKFPYFWIDDVLVTGIIAEELGIEREGLNNKYTIHSAHMRCCADEHYYPLRYYCDYFAGPTGGDHMLLASALDQFHNCYRKGCKSRTGQQTIARTCVATPKDMPTGRGVGEVIAIA
uniref:Hexosyltransferase n=2 Tax=Hirondellea gigas TaxID=1518452 RepID=A0A6A7G1G8_9CRUS